MDENDDREAIKAEARRLHQRARRWWVEVPEDWYYFDDEDFESLIAGIHHDRVRLKIRRNQLGFVVGVIATLGTIAALF